jgi:hypothetical protein
MGAPVDEFGRSLDDTNGFVSDSQQRTDDLVTSVLNLNNGFSDTAQSASQLSDALDKLISPELDLDQANIAWQRSLTALDTALKTGAHTLNINTKAGQDHRDAIDASVAALKTQLKSEADASRGSQFLTNHLRTGIAAILDSAKAAHLNKDEVAAMLAKYNLTPKLIRTLVEAETNKAKGAVDDYNKNSVGKIPKTATTDVSVTGVDVASAGVDALTRNLQTLDEMSVTADATVTVTRIDKVLTQLGTGIFHAAGGVFSGPTRAIIGEAGPEAVVPLSRPLSQVDPAVRWLSAIAQGKASAGLAGSGARTIEIGGITIVTPATDPVAVATETVNVLTARSSL